jgi:hypothetical protein
MKNPLFESQNSSTDKKFNTVSSESLDDLELEKINSIIKNIRKFFN